MTTLIITISAETHSTKLWWASSATVTAELDGIRYDETHGHCSGCGYDLISSSVNEAVSCNPLLQSLPMWNGWKLGETDFDNYALTKDCRGWNFDGAGMGSFIRAMKRNGFKTSCMSRSFHGVHTETYVLTRDMPQAFVRTI